MYLTQCLHAGLQRYPHKRALQCGDVSRSYGELHRRVEKIAGSLRGLGIRRGDRVVILAYNSVPYVETLFALWWLGAVGCPLNTRWSGAEIAFAINDCEARMLLIDDAMKVVADSIAPTCPKLEFYVAMDDTDIHFGGTVQEQIIGIPTIPDERYDCANLALLLYTGGTTGRAKGVMLTHGNLWSAAMSRLADNTGYFESTCVVVTALFHIAAFIRLLPYLSQGGTCILIPQFRAGELIDIIEREHVTDLPVVPSMLQMLVSHLEFEREKFRSVNSIAFGAAPISDSLLTQIDELFPKAKFQQAYGMTESCAIGTMTRASRLVIDGRLSPKAASAGKSCTGIELRIVGTNGEDMPCNTVGEILMRGPTVTPGYWRRPEESSKALVDGWLHTGDAGMLDEDGHLFVADRLKDMIISGGENVYSAEVENALAQHESVACSCVIGIPHPQWGEAVHAVVVLRSGSVINEIALREHCRTRLATYKCPKSFEFVETLPLTAAGKIAKHLVRDRFKRAQPRDAT